MDVRRLHDISDRDFDTIVRLLEQLHGPIRNVPTKSSMTKCIRDHHVLVVRTRLGEILGMGTLVHTARFNGLRAHCEEFVVQSDSRRRGIGRAIFLKMIEIAREQGASQLELFTNAKHNVAACKFYESFGMKVRPNNVRYVLTHLR